MAGLELTEFVLLICDFQVLAGSEGEDEEARDAIAEDEVSHDAEERLPEAEAELADGEDDSVWKSIELEGAELRYSADIEDDEFVLVAHLALTDPTSPYSLHVVTGSRFTVPEPAVTVEAAETTLVFIAYPYLREVVANITSRSPYRGFTLPPLTRLPHPRVLGEEESTTEGNE